MGYSRRSYRQGLCPAGMESFTVSFKETDLWIAVDRELLDREAELPQKVEQYLWNLRRSLEKYIEVEPSFREAMTHFVAGGNVQSIPPVALEMIRAANRAGVGPMAAVAGAFAQYVGSWLLQKCSQVVVENGGDIFLRCDQPLKVGIFAGRSPFSGRLALQVKPRPHPRGVCTSSASVGPSYSMGKADAAVILAADAVVADAVATAAANAVQSEEDLEKALQLARGVTGVEGALVILGQKLAAWGEIHLLDSAENAGE